MVRGMDPLAQVALKPAQKLLIYDMKYLKLVNIVKELLLHLNGALNHQVNVVSMD